MGTKITEGERERLLLKAGKEYAFVYMLMTCAIDHADEGNKAIQQLGMYRTEIKMNAERVQKAFDVFCRDFKKYLAHGNDKVILADWGRVSEGINKVLEEEL